MSVWDRNISERKKLQWNKSERKKMKAGDINWNRDQIPTRERIESKGQK